MGCSEWTAHCFAVLITQELRFHWAKGPFGQPTGIHAVFRQVGTLLAYTESGRNLSHTLSHTHRSPNMISSVLLLALIGILTVTGWGLFSSSRSVTVGIIATLPILPCLLGAWHAWVEAQDVAWTIGYMTIGALALASAVRQFDLFPTGGS